MKWFKHFSDAYTNMKLRQVMALYGMEGYGYWWLMCELVAQQGRNFRIKGKKNWKLVLKMESRLDDEKNEEYLSYFSEIGLISKKALEIGDLYLPNMKEYSDEYTKKLQRVSGQSMDNVLLDKKKNRLNKNRLDKNINKHKYGEYSHVLLTDIQKQKLEDKLGITGAQNAIKELDEGIEMKGYKYKSHYLAILKWQRGNKSNHKSVTVIG